MIRQVLTIIIPILAPTLIYLFIKTRSGTPITIAAKDAPWVWLAAGGVTLAAAILVTWALTTGGDTSSTYQPAQVIDGKVVPGEIVPRDTENQ